MKQKTSASMMDIHYYSLLGCIFARDWPHTLSYLLLFLSNLYLIAAAGHNNKLEKTKITGSEKNMVIIIFIAQYILLNIYLQNLMMIPKKMHIISEFIQKYKRIFYIYIFMHYRGSKNIEQDVLGGNYICFAFVEALLYNVKLAAMFLYAAQISYRWIGVLSRSLYVITKFERLFAAPYHEDVYLYLFRQKVLIISLYLIISYVHGLLEKLFFGQVKLLFQSFTTCAHPTADLTILEAFADYIHVYNLNTGDAYLSQFALLKVCHIYLKAFLSIFLFIFGIHNDVITTNFLQGKDISNAIPAITGFCFSSVSETGGHYKCHAEDFLELLLVNEFTTLCTICDK
ncbi:hypothetical protein ACJX0J_009782, partial [Zea mays]